jgi:ribosomal protein S6
MYICVYIMYIYMCVYQYVTCGAVSPCLASRFTLFCVPFSLPPSSKHSCLSEVYIKHRRLVSLQRHAKLERHVRIAENRRKPVFRVVLDGMKHLRAAMDMKRQRNGWARWFAFAWDAAATQFAERHCALHLQHRTIRALRVYVRNEVDRRKRWEFEEAERQKAREVSLDSIFENMCAFGDVDGWNAGGWEYLESLNVEVWENVSDFMWEECERGLYMWRMGVRVS